MAYEQIEAAIQRSLQELTAVFDTTDATHTDVTRGNFRVLDSGSPPYAVLVPGPFQSEPVAGFSRSSRQQTKDNWMVDLYLFEKHNGDGSEFINLAATRTAVMNKLRKTAMPSGLPLVVRAGNELQEVYDEEENGPFFLMQMIRCENMELSS